jgi:3-oxoacyl-[acyl-carrier-protein] synthase II
MRIAVTGLCAITALGVDQANAWSMLCKGKNGFSEIPYWDSSLYKTKIAGVAKSFNPANYFSQKEIKQLDYAHLLAIAAAKLALQDANLNLKECNLNTAGLFIGTSLSGMISGQKYHRAVVNEHKISPAHKANLICNYPMHVILDKLTEYIGFLGPRSLISTACTASTIAIAHAMEALRLNQADIILAGGVDPLCELSFAGFSCMQNMSTQPCSPFSSPSGLNLGEGAGMLILEKMENAVARGAKIYAELIGYGLTADAYHSTSPDASALGQKNLILTSLQNSSDEIQLNQIDYINAHGTGTQGNDFIESKGIQLAFKEKAKEIPVSSLKGAIGHTLGAAGAIEAIFTSLAIYHQKIPPTANFKQARIGCELNYIVKKSISTKINVALTQNFAFGGNNAALVMKRFCRSKNKLKVDHAVEVSTKKFERVVITGISIISPIGSCKLDFKKNCIDKNKTMNGVIHQFNPKNYSHADFRRADRIGALTVCAAEMALLDAGLNYKNHLPIQTGIIIGTDCGPLESTRKFHEPIAVGLPSKVNPLLFPNTVLNAGAGLASIHLKLKGPNAVLNIGQASGLRAMTYAFDLIKSGMAQRLITGGVDELSDFKLQAVKMIKSLKNYNVGEGACFFVLESLTSALERNATIYGEVLGHDCGADKPKYRGWDHSGEGLARCMANALRNSQMELKDIDILGLAAIPDVSHQRIELKSIKKINPQNVQPLLSEISSLVGYSSATAPMNLGKIILENQHQHKKILINSASLGGTNVSCVIKLNQEINNA